MYRPLLPPLPCRRCFEASLAVPHSAQRIITDNRYQLSLEEALDLSLAFPCIAPYPSSFCRSYPQSERLESAPGGPVSSMDMGQGSVGLWSEGQSAPIVGEGRGSRGFKTELKAFTVQSSNIKHHWLRVL
jgi:hypothetical protein